MQKARITIQYHETVTGGGSFSVEELPARIQETSTFDYNLLEYAPYHLPRIIVYHHCLLTESGVPISLRPLVQQETVIAALILGIFYIRMDAQMIEMLEPEANNDGSFVVYLNEHAIEDLILEDVWNDVKYLQTAGVKVIGSLDMCEEGPRPQGNQSLFGSCDDLTFERSYKALNDLVNLKSLNGINLGVEGLSDVVDTQDKMVLVRTASRLIDRLRNDFGPNFIIMMTASVQALLNSDTDQERTRIDYRTSKRQSGYLVNWYIIRLFSRDNHDRN